MTVDEYLANVEPEQRAVLERVRMLIQRVAPEAIESISYGMPAYKYHGKPLAYYAAFKDHLSFFPTPDPADKFKEQLATFKTSKGTIQFTVEHPLPDDLITAMLRYRIEQLASQQ
jgi:uncharacterized protein YdhG (YjbR/CyaY superfamily)